MIGLAFHEKRFELEHIARYVKRQPKDTFVADDDRPADHLSQIVKRAMEIVGAELRVPIRPEPLDGDVTPDPTHLCRRDELEEIRWTPPSPCCRGNGGAVPRDLETSEELHANDPLPQNTI